MILPTASASRPPGANAMHRYKIIELLCIVALAAAYLTHLGYLPLDTESDEARRAVVTAEMMITHNYVTPTINGDVYLNKPPLYNWIVSGYFKVFGDYSMFAFRLQVIVAVFLTGWVIYSVVKKYTSHTVAFFSAFAYMTNGRLLIYESLYGFIDTTFALAVFAGMMAIFYFGEKRKFYLLFIGSYVLCAAAFLLKGIPAIAFQGLTLCTYFLLNKEFKKLLALPHLVGMAVFILLLGGYYGVYFSVNHFSPLILFDNLFHESAQRTFIEYGYGATVKHAGTFPFEVLYHFLPWTIFLLTCLRKDFWRLIRQNRFMRYIFWVFIANIPIYWLSVDVYPKYLFMFVPLLYCTAFYTYEQGTDSSWQKRVLNGIMMGSCILLTAASLAIPFLHLQHPVDFTILKTGFLTVAFACSVYLASGKKYIVYAFALALVIARIGFNWFVIPQRGERFVEARNWAQQIVEITSGKNLYILDTADTRNFDGFSFYIETGRDELLRKTGSVAPNAYYIVDPNQLKHYPFHVDLEFINLPFQNRLYLVHLTAQ